MKNNPWFIFIILLLGIFVALEANAFTTPALPYISEYFGISIGNSGLLTLLASSAAIVFAPLFGRLGDQVGRKKVIVVGLIIFFIAQSIKIFTPFVGIFLLGSLLQGIGYALIFPNVFAYIPELFPENKRGKAIGLFMLFSYIATGTGGAVAGALIDVWGWHSVFVVSAMVALIGLILISIFVPKSEKGKQAALDYKGGTVFMLAITLFVAFPLIYTNFGLISALVGGLFLAVLLGLFLQIQKKAEHPVVDFKLLKLKGVYIPAILIAFQNFMMLSILMSLTYLTAQNPDMSALQVGVITTVLFSTAAIFSPMIGSLLDRFNPIYLVYVSLVSGVIGILMYFGVSMSSSLMYIASVMVFVGICSSFLNASLMKIILTYTPKDKKGVSTGTFSLFKDLGLPVGTTLGLAIYGMATTRSFDSAIQAETANLGLTGDQVNQLVNAQTTGNIPTELESTLAQTDVNLTQLLTQASSDSVTSGIYALGTINLIIFIGLIIISLGLLKLKYVRAEESVDASA
ncbi:MFS transporter [Aquibacillus saliphilus]|uniref:MFS transporter n=1 Tax=Aquibacillus saliphilus TaxID=1909422 RepID=UPI001CEFFE6D|nr:MFS transporter [Aquibacillus saliphilus]